ncbi:uncharacterized protein LOC142224539 [Haematobia irritans]|uniref:uncharacterized protein LOC142224539 n=1 Tax=Haematobia irritans TaxID=7368 RepID=UPI003F4FA1B2
MVKTNVCYTKRISSLRSETTINVTLLQEVRSAAIRLEFVKKSNQKYNAYLFKSTLFDACKFMEKRSSAPIANYFYKMIENYTNLNHTCPYRDHLLLDRLRIDVDRVSILPLPSGEYGFYTRWYAHGKARFLLSLYFTYGEK